MTRERFCIGKGFLIVAVLTLLLALALAGCSGGGDVGDSGGDPGGDVSSGDPGSVSGDDAGVPVTSGSGIEGKWVLEENADDLLFKFEKTLRGNLAELELFAGGTGTVLHDNVGLYDPLKTFEITWSAGDGALVLSDLPGDDELEFGCRTAGDSLTLFMDGKELKYRRE